MTTDHTTWRHTGATCMHAAQQHTLVNNASPSHKTTWRPKLQRGYPCINPFVITMIRNVLFHAIFAWLYWRPLLEVYTSAYWNNMTISYFHLPSHFSTCPIIIPVFSNCKAQGPGDLGPSILFIFCLIWKSLLVKYSFGCVALKLPRPWVKINCWGFDYKDFAGSAQFNIIIVLATCRNIFNS